MSKLLEFVRKYGRTPQVGLTITPIDSGRGQIHLSNFLTYQFTSSVLIPVDAFQFTFTMPGSVINLGEYIKDGDLIELWGDSGNNTICTGIVDFVDCETTIDGGDVVTIIGRNLVGQLEDNSTVNATDKPMWANSASLDTAVGSVIQHTRIPGYNVQNAPSGSWLFATEPGETKLSALQRFVEPLNCLLWGDSSGSLIVGRPNMGSTASGDLICDYVGRKANVLNMKSTRGSTQIPNILTPVWSGQETVQNRVSPEQSLVNASEGPLRLFQRGHFVQRCVVVSTPSGSDPQSLSDINMIKVGGSNLLQAYAVRELARANISELQVQANVKGHYNDNLDPFMIDTVYNVNYSRAGIQERMYLYQVDYSMDSRTGPRTSLHLCRLGRIVAGVSGTPAARSLKAAGGLPKL